MKILVIDTSGPVCGTAVMDEEKVYSEFTAQNKNTHSASLMPMIEAALNAAEEKICDAMLASPADMPLVEVGGKDAATA